MTMTRDEARAIISDLIEWYTEDLGERLGLSMGKDTYMDALEVLWHGPEGELISRADAIDAVIAQRHRAELSDYNFALGLAEDAIRHLPSAEAVTNGRLIDANALSKKLCETTIFVKDGELFQRMINDAPTVSAEAVQGWIPCSERLPCEKDGRVLVTKRGEVMTARYSEFSGTWYVGEMCAVGGEDPIAWMPLPKPYREDGE